MKKMIAGGRMLNQRQFEERNTEYKGKRVELVQLNDPYATMEPGTQGTIHHVDSLGTLHVDWDNGRTIGLVPGEDSYRFI